MKGSPIGVIDTGTSLITIPMSDFTSFSIALKADYKSDVNKIQTLTSGSMKFNAFAGDCSD
jgi:hypothetical protein